MITASNISLSYGTQVLFKEVNIKFTPGNCYGVIGANGAGKSTFLKILSGEIEPDTGDVIVTPGERIAVLKQDHFAFNDHTVLETVIMGYERLYQVMTERDAIYAKEHFTEEDGIKAAELEGEFAELGGWEAEAEAGVMLNGLGIQDDLLQRRMGDIEDNLKVRVLLAQALFGNPDILLLDEPTNHLDLKTKEIFQNALLHYSGTILLVSHDRHFLDNLVGRVLELRDGRLHEYLGNYSDFLRRREAELAAEASGQSAPAPVRQEEPRRSGRTREERRLEAEERNRLGRARRELAGKVQALEAEIGALEEVKSRNHRWLCDPDVLRDSPRVQELMKELSAAETRLKKRLPEWEKLMAQLEELNAN